MGEHTSEVGQTADRLKLRRIDFEFAPDIPFHFNPNNIAWSHFVNVFTVVAPAFERYVVRATREALPQIRSERVRRDADLFCKQESQHARHHMAHLRVLIEACPELEGVRQEVDASFDRLRADEPLEFHLAYAASTEGMIGPVAKAIVEYRDPLFAGGDPRISSFILWHFLEEFEHRNSAIDIYDDVVGSYPYRLRQLAAVLRHLMSVSAIVERGLERCAPVRERGPGGVWAASRGIPAAGVAALAYRLVCTFLPFHRPDRLRQPAWATEWFADEAAGQDMREYYAR